VGLGSLAGIPPLGGFIGKLFLFVAAYQAGLYGLIGIAILGVAISIYYYFGWIRECYFGTAGDTSPVTTVDATSSGDRLILIALVLATVCLGLYPAALPIIP
jgi:NADH-quinone oxidoreductase subunit N